MDINHIFDDLTISIWIPSIAKQAKFKPVKVYQLNQIQQFVSDQQDRLNPEFDQYFLKIIQENDTEGVSKSLTYWDYESVGHELLANIHQKLIPLGNHPSPEIIEAGNAKITCQIPLMDRHLETDQWLYTLSQSLSGDSIVELLGQRITKSLLAEFSKYIHAIEISQETLLLGDISMEQRITLIQRLPADAFETIFNRITVWQQSLRKTFPTKFGPWLFL